jgi:hypothetical protein
MGTVRKVTGAALADMVSRGERPRILVDGESDQSAAIGGRTGSDRLVIPTTRKTGVQTVLVTGVQIRMDRSARRAVRLYDFVTSAGRLTVYGVNTIMLAPEDAAAVKRAHAEALLMDAEMTHHAVETSETVPAGISVAESNRRVREAYARRAATTVPAELETWETDLLASESDTSNAHYACDTHGAVCPTGEHHGHRSQECPRCLAETVPAEPVHYSYGKIIFALGDAEGTVTVTLRDGDTAEAPGTTKRVLQGPATITYRVYRDGGMGVVDPGTATLVAVPRRDPGTEIIGGQKYGTASGLPIFPREAPDPATGFRAREAQVQVPVIPVAPVHVRDVTGVAACGQTPAVPQAQLTGDPYDATCLACLDAVSPSPSMLIGSASYGRTTDDRLDGPKRFRASHGKRKVSTVRRYRRG